jgi:HD-GYP domain-containing protein (c-di-GMP phosphodiesterase class II)
MIDIKNEKIPASQLELGMFVSALDKPWIESDFMLQGFVLEDQTDLDKIKSTCTYVYVDRTKSIGNQFAAAAKRNVAIKHNSTIKVKAPSEIENKNTPVINKARRGEKVSFFDILREVKSYQSPKNAASGNNEGTIFNLRNGADTTLQTTLPFEHNPNNKPSTTASSDSGIFSRIGNFVGDLLNREKLKAPVKTTFKEPDLSHLSDDERIIYEQEPPVEEEIAAIYPVFEQSEIVTRDIFEAIAHDHQMDISGVSDVLDNMVESIGRTPDALLWLAKLKRADGLAYNLALNVSVTLMAFNSFLALPKEQIKISGLAGLLQDIGKVKLSSDVLLKKSKLTREEYEYAQKHVDESLIILRETPDIPSEVIRLVAEHHERIDGSGYPFNLKGSQLSLLSQSAGLIDTYCAMTNHRSYAQGAYHQQALDEIHALSGKQFSTEIIDQLIQFMGIYPVSSLVELNTGEVGVVVQQNQVRRLMPRVMLLLDNNKERFSAPIVIDLIHKPTTPDGDIYTIVKGIPADSYGLNPSEFYV